MKNITFETSSFSEQLGIYDFFNVFIAGGTFVCGMCVININIARYILDSGNFIKSVGLILLIYLVGMILQEIGSKADRRYFNIYRGFNRSILKGALDDKYNSETTNRFVKNPLVLERYRKTANNLLKDFYFEDEHYFENDYVNGYVFSVCQYYVSIHGKDKKVEKLRALFAMSKTLTVCFFLLALFAFLSIFIKTEPFFNIFEILCAPSFNCDMCINKVTIAGIFALMGMFFISRSKRVMENFLLILLGTYDAIVRSEENYKTINSHKQEDIQNDCL